MLDQDADGDAVHSSRASGATASTGSRAWWTARPTRRSSASIRRWRTRTSTLVTQRQGRAARDRRVGSHRHGAWCVTTADGTEAALLGRRGGGVVRRAQLGACCCCARRTTRIRTGSPTARTRSGATTCATTTSALMALSKEPEPDRCSRRRSRSTTGTSRATDTDFPWGGIQMLGKSDGEQLKGKAPHWLACGRRSSSRVVAGHGRAPRRRLLAVAPRTCPHPDNRVTIDGDGAVHLALVDDQHRGPEAAAQEVRVDAQRPRHARGPARTQALPPQAHGHRRRPPTRRARHASAPTPRRRCSTSTARPTSSTTSTSSTRASSRRIGAVNPTLTIIANATPRRRAPHRAARPEPGRPRQYRIRRGATP